jgi:predicted metal-dependent hydrolase
MEAATPLPFAPQVRVAGDRLRIDGLVVDDDCAVRLAREREEAGDDATKLVLDAIGIGARVLDRELAGANAEFVKTEFERAARELDAGFVERARLVAEKLDAKVDEAFGPENGHVARALERHFADGSSEAVQHKVRAVVAELSVKMREDLQKQFSSDGDSNPLATFQRMAIGAMRENAQRQAEQLRGMDEKLAGLREEVVKLQAERDKREEVAAEAERGTAKGRTYEEAVAEAIDAIALPLGDDAMAVGDVKESTGKVGDVVVAIGACAGPVLGRIVFEAKNAKLTRPKAFEELDRAKAERNADYAVLVVPSDEKVPAKMHALREYNGDKLIVAYDADEGPLALQVAYSLARARVLMARGGGEGIDGAAVIDTAERALAALEDVRRIRQQLTGAKTQIDKASEIVGAMSERVRGHLDEIQELVRAASADVEDADADAG